MDNKNGGHYLATVGAMLIWSSSFIATKVAYPHIPAHYAGGGEVPRGAGAAGRYAHRDEGEGEAHPGAASTHRVQRLYGHHALLPV